MGVVLIFAPSALLSCARLFFRLFCCVLLWHGASAGAVEVDLLAPDAVRPVLQRFLELKSDPDAGEQVGQRRRLRGQATEILASEGYFTPEITFEDAGQGRISMRVQPGPQAKVVELSIGFTGAITEAADGPHRMAALREAFALPVGQAFRDARWSEAKQNVLVPLLAEDYAAARLAESLADVDGEKAEVHLKLLVDSGPAFTLGELEISGLKDYPPELVQRYSRLKPGQRYSQDRLLALQTALQNTPYFSSARVEIEPDPEKAQGAPVKVLVAEALPRRFSIGGGVSTNTGARGELAYRDADFLGRAWNLNSALHADHTRQVVFADIFLPPPEDGRHRDSFGALLDQSHNQGLHTRRGAVGVVRSQTRNHIEARYAVNFQREIQRVDGDEGATDVANALTLNASWTRRAVDDVLNPRSGNVINFQLGGASRALLASQHFLRTYTHVQIYFPVGKMDVFSLRGELGWTLAASRHGIPEDFLFRTGGAQSVRGYAYQSLGASLGGAIVGGRYLAVGGAEYTHWFNGRWAGALFYDAGGAADSRQDYRALQGLGVGGRWKSPAGPLAFDLAYSRRDHQVRPHFSLSIAF